MTLPIPNTSGNVSTQKIKSSWVNNLAANAYVGPIGTIFFDTYDGVLRLGDNVTPGGQILSSGGNGGGTPGLPLNSIQYNGAGTFAGNTNLTYDPVAGVLSLTGNANVTGNINTTGDVVSAANVYGATVIDTVGIFLDADQVTANYVIPPNFNGLTGGPITVINGVSVYVPDGQRWTIV